MLKFQNLILNCVLCGSQMVAAVSGQFNQLVEKVIVLDCRYPYEFEGGHIKVSENPPQKHFYKTIIANFQNEGFACVPLNQFLSFSLYVWHHF